MKILLLGGTAEARELAKLLVDQHFEVISSLAGRTTSTRRPTERTVGTGLPVGQVRVGGFGGVDGLVAWLRENPVDAVVDATHPFAAQMTAHAAEATTRVGVPLLVLRRPGWDGGLDDNWHWVDTAAAAAELLPRLGSRVFLTIGRQGLETFARTGLWTLARCVDAPDPVPTWCTLILARGPFTLADERALLQHHQLDVIVTKDSGGPATAAKLTAARELNLPVVVIRRPALPTGLPTVATVTEAAHWVTRASHSPST